MSKLLKRMLKEIGLLVGFTLLQKLQTYVDKSEGLEETPKRRSTDVQLTSVVSASRKATSD